jgi:hypothetical protein
MKAEYRSAAEARKNFESATTKLFRAPRPPKPEKQPKKNTASEEKEDRMPWRRKQIVNRPLPPSSQLLPYFRRSHSQPKEVKELLRRGCCLTGKQNAPIGPRFSRFRAAISFG